MFSLILTPGFGIDSSCSLFGAASVAVALSLASLTLDTRLALAFPLLAVVDLGFDTCFRGVLLPAADVAFGCSGLGWSWG
jgi:hypothetical protein